jgi:glucose-6-phosphate isomerase
MTVTNTWPRFAQYYFSDDALGFSLDISRMAFDDGFFDRMEPAIQQALDALEAVDRGAIANPDEKRMVGHYWLRDAALAPAADLRQAIEDTLAHIKAFARQIHEGQITGGRDRTFEHVLVVGIGGSALGPQLVADALGTADDRMALWFLDNTDPDGIQRVLEGLSGQLDRTLTLVISKSGGTPETRNGMLEAAQAYDREGLCFETHAVAVTGEGSALGKMAQEKGWLASFPMWDWVGGRTSVTSAVGLLPAALQGLDIDALLEGARAMDALDRRRATAQNPAALLALMWHWAGQGRGARDMVVLPYKDRLVLFSKYLQQLVMESLGKELDLKGNTVNQGLAVYGNKGSTDQHAYVQQLREGLNNFFATFVEVLREDAGSRAHAPVEVESGITAGDYLAGFLLGTREALTEKGRPSITISIRELNARSLGMLIALFERAVGLYAALIGINAYHQPGVEAGKKAARAILDLQNRLLTAMEDSGDARTAAQWAEAIDAPEQTEAIFLMLERLAANPDRGIERQPGAGGPETTSYRSGN